MNDPVRPTAERYKHARGSIVVKEVLREGAKTATAADHVERCVNEGECELDRLRDRGRLGRGDMAETRWMAGIWLRQLYLKTHPQALQALVASYEYVEPDQSEMSEVMAWNLKCYQDTSMEMGDHWKILEHVCCEDDTCSRIERLNDALDALAAWRGIT